MQTSVKVTISLPTNLLDQIEEERKGRGETRSEVIRGAIEQVFRERREQSERDRYIIGYEECPESDEEIALADHLSRSAFAADPWG